MKNVVVAVLAAAAVAGCAHKNAVMVSTGTCLGFEISENPASQLYRLKFGYARTELAYVPTNKGDTNCPTTGGGAKDTADVLTEMNFQNIMHGGGLYQRMAVGKTAVAQPGASVMFAKGADGNISSNAAAVLRAIGIVPSVDSTNVSALLPATEAYQKSTQKSEFDAIAKKFGYESFAALVLDAKVAKSTIELLLAELKIAKLLP